MNVLVLAPHPDDETIGCGGVLCMHARDGDRVLVAYLTSGELGLKRLAREEAWRVREEEARQACRVLGCVEPEFLRFPDWGLQDQIDALSQRLGPILRRETPGMIYLPHPQDAHPDHHAVWPMVCRALGRAAAATPVLLGYEVWSPMATHDVVRDITPHWRTKLRALHCHRSQLGEIDYQEAMRGLSRYRGVTAARCRYAEVFQTLALEG